MNRRCLAGYMIFIACAALFSGASLVHAQDGIIQGSTRLKTSTTAPIGGIQIQLLNRAGSVVAETTSKPDGSFVFDHVIPGDYTITSLSTEHYLYREDVKVSPHMTSLCILVLAKKNGDTKGAVGGTLINGTTGEPVSGAQVAVYRPGDDSSREATTGSDGSWLIGGLPEGTYQFFVDNPPTLYIQYSGVSFAPQPGYVVWQDVFTGAKESGLGGLFGTVEDEYGNPLPGTEVTVSGGGETYKLTTDENGRYGSTKIKPGSSYVITTQKTGYETETKSSVTIQDGFSANHHFTLAEPVTGGTVGGTITDSSTGNPVSGATVTMSNDTDTKTASTSSDGKYNITGLGTDKAYKIEVTKEGYHTTKRTGIEPKKTTPVTEDERLVPKIAGHGAIIGKVTVAGTDTPLAGIKVTVEKHTLTGVGDIREVIIETVAEVTTDSNGNFTFPGLDPGTHTVKVKGLEKGYMDSGSQKFDIKDCNAVVMIASLSSNTNSGAAGFRGKVIDASTNKAVSGASVKASNGTETKTVETDGQGVYRIPDLSPKKPWNLEVSKEGYHKSNAKRIEIRPGEEVIYDERMIQKIQGKGAIVGRVVEAPFDKPVSNAQVTVYQSVTNGTLTKYQPVTTLTTDSDGNFNVSGLAPGKYYVNVNATGFYKLATDNYEIKECNALVLKVPLADKTVFGGGDVTGVLIDPETGKVIPQATVYADSDPYGFQYPGKAAAGTVIGWKTDDSGMFHLSGLVPDSTYTLTVTGAGLYHTAIRGIRVQEGESLVRTVYSSPIGNRATGAIGGLVTGTSGAEIAGACVTLSPGGRTAVTDLDGIWGIKDVSPADNYTVTVSASGYPPKEMKNVTVTAGAMANLNISIGNELTLSPPTNLTAMDNKGTTLTLKWNLSPADSLVTEYKLYRSCRDIFREPVIPALRLTSQAALVAAEKDSVVYIGSVPAGTSTYIDTPAQSGATYSYWVQAVSVNGYSEKATAIPVVGVEDKVKTFRVSGFHPNPFNPTASIEYRIPAQSRVMLDIYDVLGRKVANLEDRILAAGSHVTTWNGRDSCGSLLGSGVYLYRLRAGEFMSSGKVMLLR